MRASPRTQMALILLLALGLRLGWALYARPVPLSDYLEYRNLAAAILDHGAYGYPQPTAFRLPAYPLLLALFMLVGRSDLWLSLVNVLLSTAMCLAAAALARRLFPGRAGVGRLAALACALNPAFVFYSPLLASEHLFVLLMTAVLLLGLGESAGRPRTVLAGLVWGAAALTRGEALFYAPVVLGLFAWRGRRQGGWRAGVVTAGVVLLAAGGVIGPWWLRNRLVIGPGAGLATNSGMTFYEGHNPYHYGYRGDYKRPPFRDLGKLERQRLAWRLGLRYIREHPAGLLHSIWQGTWRLWRPSRLPVYLSTRAPPRPGDQTYPAKPLAGLRLFEALCLGGYVLLVLLALWSLRGWRRWPRTTLWLVGGVVFCNWLGYAVVFWGMSRYRFFVELILCLVAAAALAGRRVAGGLSRPAAGP